MLALEEIAIKLISTAHYVNNQQQNSILRNLIYLIYWNCLHFFSDFLEYAQIERTADLYVQV